MDYGFYVQQNVPLTNLNPGSQGKYSLGANIPAPSTVLPLVPDSTCFDVLRIYRSSVKRTAVMHSSSPQSMKWIYYSTIFLNILALWVMYMFSTATFSLFGYFITSPPPAQWIPPISSRLVCWGP
ncbi:uncharacterized protein ARMOST_17525 [Armillaria ostoyae]|uniref:Uncharacterized protein n=1 Tax=Armillaria ostoyae TaxID=47428 RepID=A0A284RZC8_ARMOS|nr:uncharacterized protein ARMOST_17525 [Armillaria ostoyae]